MKLTLETISNGVKIRIEEEYDPNKEKEWIKRGIAITQFKRAIYELNKKEDSKSKKLEEKYPEPSDADWDSLMEDIENAK